MFGYKYYTAQTSFFLLLQWKEFYLVTAYSLRPPWRLVAEKVPIQPRSRRSRPIFHVTNKGLKRDRHTHKQFKNSKWSIFHTCDKRCETHTHTQYDFKSSIDTTLISTSVDSGKWDWQPILLPLLISVIVNVSLFWVHWQYLTHLVTVAQVRVTVPIISQCDSSNSKWDHFDTSITYQSGVPLPTECEC